MSTTVLQVKSKIWKKEYENQIDYSCKDTYTKKMLIENSGIIGRKKQSIYFKETKKDNDIKNNKNSENIELLSIEKNEKNGNFIINCGDWSKDLSKLIDQKAAYLVYKGLSAENFLNQKLRYYKINAGDIIKICRINIHETGNEDEFISEIQVPIDC